MTKPNTSAGEAVPQAATPTRTVQIDPMVALAEMQALADFYRNRSLLHAQEIHAQRTADLEKAS